MRNIFILLAVLTLVSCGGHRKGVVTKTPEGIVFDLGTDGKMTYKDAEVEATMDTKKKSGIIEDIIKLYTIQQINKRD